MKLKNIFTTLLAAVAFATGCQESLERHLAEVQVSSSYVAIPAEGGSKTITVTATGEWTISNIPDWLAIAPESGEAGETEVTFSAEAATSTNEATVNLTCNGKTQEINVIQQTEKQELPISTCAEVNAGKDGTSYRIKGEVTRITSTYYGNMYINDGTDDVYVYGTLDATGAEKNFSSLGIEVGDIVTVEGPRTTYSGTIELKNVTVIAIEKSLIKVDSLSVKTALPLEGGEVKAYLTCKGDGVSTVIPEDAKSWVSVTGIEQDGTNVTVTFNAAANAGGDRSAALSFTTKSGGKTYSATTTLEQKGAIIDATVEEFLAAEVGDTQYRLTGKIESIANEKYGNLYIQDATGRVYVYGITDWSSLELRQGDIITIVGKRARYDNAKVEDQKEEMKDAVLESSVKSTDVTIAEFLAKESSSTYLTSPYSRLSGVIKEIVKAEYGNFYLKAEDSEDYVYVYGLTKAPVAKNDKSFGELGLAEGYKVTIVGQRGSYAGAKVEDQKEEMLNAYIVTSEEGTPANVLQVNPVASLLIATDTELTIQVTCTGDWTVTKDEGDWITSYTESGSGDGTIKVEFPENTTTETRNSKFTVTSGELTASFKVDQKGVAETIYANLAELNEAILAAGTTGMAFKLELTSPAEVTKIGSDNKTAYIQDATGAIMVYGVPLTTYIENAAEKTTIKGIVTGTGVVFDGLPEVTAIDVTAATIAQDGTGIYTEATIAEMLADFNKYLNCKVKLSDATVTDAFSNSDKNGKLSQGENEIAVYVKNTKAAFSYAAGTAGDVYVYPALYKTTTKQVYFWGAEDFTVKTAGTVISVESEYSVNAGATVALGATTNTTGTLKYASSNEAVATVSAEGVVTGVAEGEATITVSVDAVEGYTAATVTTTVKVLPAGAAIAKVLIIDGSQLTSTATEAEVTKTYSGIDVVFSKGAKQQVVGSGATNNVSENPAILIGKSGAFIHNKTAIPGKITKFEIYANKGASSKVTVGVNFSADSISEYSADAANTFTAKLSPDTVSDCSEKLPENAQYFWYQVTNANNSQVQFRITYVEE